MADFDAVHERLKAILRRHADGLVITKDGPAGMTLEVPGLEGKPWGYVAGTRLGKRYVSFYLMPVYASPELDAAVSPALRRRKQGKSCFNFTNVDETLFAELDALAGRGIPASASRRRRSPRLAPSGRAHPRVTSLASPPSRGADPGTRRSVRPPSRALLAPRVSRSATERRRPPLVCRRRSATSRRSGHRRRRPA